MKKNVLHSYSSAISAALLLAAAGCSSVRPVIHSDTADTITHVGMYDDFKDGQYLGHEAVTNLARYGNHGVGVFDGLNGELIMHGGVVYRADVSCSLSLAEHSMTTPYAVVTWFDADRVFDVGSMNETLFKRALEMRRRTSGIPHAIQVEGYFSAITLRSIPQQPEPWKPLGEVVNAQAEPKEMSGVIGTMVGYYYPESLSEFHPAGYHLYFMDADRKSGGYVQAFEIGKARISIDHSPYLHVILPYRQTEAAMEKPVDPAGGL